MQKLLKRTKEADGSCQLLEEIRRINDRINAAYEEFQYQTDSDLLEASIYRLKELRARHSYLIKQAKAQGIEAKCLAFSVQEE